MSNKPKAYRNQKKQGHAAGTNVPSSAKGNPATKTEPTNRQRMFVLIAYILQFALAAVGAKFILPYIPTEAIGSGSIMRFTATMVLFLAIWLLLYWVVIRPLEKRFHMTSKEEDTYEPPTL